jgi:predicted esterase
MSRTDPHRGQPVLLRGPAVRVSRLSVILLHGRGASAEDILSLSREFDLPDVTYLAPQAADHTWYPYSFLAPLADNEPALTSALQVIDGLVARVRDEQVEADRVVVMGFSQGACLALEYAARQPRRYAAIVGLSGAVIGPPDRARAETGSLDGTPVFLGCSDLDPHIPLERVHESAALFKRLGGLVDERIYPGAGHAVNRDEIEAVQALLAGI